MSDVVNHLDLFSGIGGFHYAGEMVWGTDFNTVAHVEIDPFCQKVLKKHWPKVPIISDIKEYKHNGTTIDLLTGGFPCQPFSCAGKRRGKEDDRYLWPEMLRIISEVCPTWIIGENVAGIINMELGQVLFDLENESYEVQSFIIPACAINAPHRRDRVWVVAHSENSGSRRVAREICQENGRQNGQMRIGIENADCHAPNNAQDSINGRMRGWNNGNQTRGECPLQIEGSGRWDEPWLEVATRLCRVDDGLPRGMDRVNRLKALGNSIVPQVVVPIMQVIKELN